MLPFHLHINLDLLESIQLTVSMLLEIPSIAANSIDSPKKIISKHFRRLLEYTERQFFTGPPETARDYIMQASQALANGNWEKCRDFILQIKVWELLPDSDSIRTMLTQKIKEEGIRTFLFAFGKFYENIDLDHISEQFKLERKAVYKIVSKMILNDELHATVDLSTNTLILHRVDPNRVQHLALMLCDNASKFMDKIVENRFPTHTTEPGPEFTQSKQGARIRKPHVQYFANIIRSTTIT